MAACVFGFIAVALGAFGAHGLKKILETSKPNILNETVDALNKSVANQFSIRDTLDIWNKGISYQFYHVFALLACGLLYAHLPAPQVRWATGLFIAGIIGFSGSLYGLTWMKISGAESVGKIIGPITPLGGLCFLGGWICLLLAVLKIK